ncbi:hypothetical protein BD413DRAFT_611264 [Trametes elegans]|nr:hypothetical protein BD413DRAFT_611264 [Trametes elegans]
MAVERSSVSSLFNRSDADIVFRSSDGVDFRLHKLVLAMASPVFADMFTLPSHDSEKALSVVDLSEEASTLEDLLVLCYPMERPDFLRLSRLRDALLAAIKYEMTFASNTLKRNLRLFLTSEVSTVPPDSPPEYDSIPAAALAKAHTYRQECVRVALETFGSHQWMVSGPHGRVVTVSRKGNVDTTKSWVWLAAWWEVYSKAAMAKLSLRSLGSVVVHDQLLRHALAGTETCQTCGPKAPLDLKAYAEAVAKRIDEATSKA